MRMMGAKVVVDDLSAGVSEIDPHGWKATMDHG
jgi:hypothetical protein